MPYFFIFPAYIVLLVVFATTAIVVRCIPRFRMLSGYIVGGAVGTLIGFALINIFIWIAGLVPVWMSQKVAFPDWLKPVIPVYIAVVLLIGPFIGSAIGVLFGFAAGVYFVYRRRRRIA
ncbi:MAG: hypothetical protein ACRECJ_06460 [Limisphaerales bacterium]